jgi:hypothetical protein
VGILLCLLLLVGMLCLVVAVIINYKLQPTKFAKTNNNSAASLSCVVVVSFLEILYSTWKVEKRLVNLVPI